MKYKLPIPLLKILFLLVPVLIEAQKLSFFPYQIGDTLIYRESDFDGNYLRDVRLTITQDSTGKDGKRYLSTFLYGQEYSIDSLFNIYSNIYYDIENSRIFDRKAGVNEPWVIQKSTPSGFELTVFIRLPDDNGTQLHAE